MRKPNLRATCSNPLSMARLRATWVDVFKVRHLAPRLLGNDLGEKLFGIGEKPLHFIEAGPKPIGAIEIDGAASAKLQKTKQPRASASFS